MQGSLNRILLPAALVISFCTVPSCAQTGAIKASTLDAPARPKTLYPRHFKPEALKTLQFKDDEVTVNLYAQRFAQGYPVYAEVFRPGKDTKGLKLVQVTFNRTPIHFTPRPWGYRFILGVHPNTKPEKMPLALSYKLDGKVTAVEYAVPVEKTAFPSEDINISLDRPSRKTPKQIKETQALIKRGTAKKAKAFAALSPDRIQASLAHPRNEHFITSPFWSLRNMIRYKTEKGKRVNVSTAVYPHSGIDLKGKRGTPVFAAASGKVAIAEFMYFEGNFVTIDHGNRIFTHYMHMDSLAVKEGQVVKAGQLIGRVGNTGFSIGPHLHFSVVINGSYVDPMGFIALPIRD